MPYEVVTLAARPDLLEEAFAIGVPEHEFMQHDPTGWLYTAGILTRWPEFGVLLLDAGTVVARAMSVPFARASPAREELPADGWDGVIRWATEDVLAGAATTTVAALEITVDHSRRRTGLSTKALEAMRAQASALGYRQLVCPVRPTGKAAVPRLSMEQYVEDRRPDGLPVDPWLRVHVRAGGVVRGVAPCSMTVVGSLDEWRAWTGLPFDRDGEIDVAGGLVPVIVSQQQNVGVYVEPNVWVAHDLTDAR